MFFLLLLRPGFLNNKGKKRLLEVFQLNGFFFCFENKLLVKEALDWYLIIEIRTSSARCENQSESRETKSALSNPTDSYWTAGRKED